MMTRIVIECAIYLPDVHLRSGLASTPWLVNAAVRSMIEQSKENIEATHLVMCETKVEAMCMTAYVNMMTHRVSDIEPLEIG